MKAYCASVQTHIARRCDVGTKVCVFGAGYVGLVAAACLADMGNSVVCVDVDAARVDALQRGEIPIHEPGLGELVTRNAIAGRLQFTADAASAVAHGTIVFIAVGTPAAEDGSADLGHVLAAAAIGRHMRDYKVIANKSTVPVATAELVRATLLTFAVVPNPEFLKEGEAIEDFMRPDRVIIGADDEQATLLMDVRSAELTKYVANAMLAAMKLPLVLDGRNLYDPALMRQLGFDHVGIGRAEAVP
ncbi:MAG: hypothetical protein Q8L92_09185, partial [Rubrivivax sp.]|nr:hypothetical protein [Rubrivivax sp.]